MLRACISGCLVGIGGLVIVACSSGGEHDPLLEDFESLDQAAKKPNGVNGAGDYCNNPAALCTLGEGDCDYPYQCVAGLTCVANNGPKFLMPVGHDVCAPAHCSNGVLDGNETAIDCGGSCSSPSFVCADACAPYRAAYPNGDANRCTADCPCPSGEGDCDYSYHCQAGLACVTDNGPKFLMPVGHDVCAPAHCGNGVLDGNETAVDCGGSCSSAGFSCLDACAAHRAAYPNGNSNHCTTSCPCPSGEGDCDTHSHCQAGLVCGSNNGDKFGAAAGDDYCVPPTCVNGVLDVGETAPDCGGPCGSCGQFFGLGDLPGGTVASYARAVSRDGSVIVGYSQSANGIEAFRWTLPGGMQPLGDLAGGAFQSIAYAVNDTGTVVAGQATTASGNAAFRWTAAGGMVAIGDLPGGGVRSGAYGISNNGAVVVGWSASANGTEAFSHAGSTMTPLGDLAGGSFFSEAWAANSTGTVIVGRGQSVNGQEAFRWTSGGLVGLGDLAGGTFSSLATAVNPTGTIITGNGTSAGGSQAFRWTSSGMVGLGFPAGTTSSYAFGINSAGNRIVGTATDGVSNVAFLWSSTGGMLSLQDILTSQGADLTGWTLQLATGISGDGTWIVGYGLNPSGDVEAFRARIP